MKNEGTNPTVTVVPDALWQAGLTFAQAHGRSGVEKILKKLQESVDGKFRTAIKAPMKRLQAVTTAWSFTEKKGEISSPKTDPTPIEPKPMKKFLITAAIVISCAFTVVPRASAQTANLVWGGVPASVAIGQSFTLSLNLVFAPGGGIPNLNGFSLWLTQNGSGGLLLTDRQIGASLFSDLQTSNFNLFGGAMGGGISEIMDPINRQGFGTAPTNQINTDLGALSGPPQGAGTYFLMNVTFMPTALGNFTIGNATSATPNVGGRISVINDSNGNTSNIPSSLTSVITVVPEPSSIALLCVGLMSAGVVAYRRRAAAR